LVKETSPTAALQETLQTTPIPVPRKRAELLSVLRLWYVPTLSTIEYLSSKTANIRFFPDHSGAYLTNLPPELHLSIFDNLDPVSSACLGLTSKKFYPMHRSAHRKVGLYQGAEQPLHVLLKDWTPSDLVLDWESERLVSRERFDVLEEVRRRERERRAYWLNASYHPGAYRHFERDRDRERERLGHYEVVQPRYDEGKRKLRRRGRMEKHDIWTSGRRR
jgi:hypothetical protein